MRKLKFLQLPLLLAATGICMIIFVTSCEQDVLENLEINSTSTKSALQKQDQPVFTKYQLDKEKLVEMDASNQDETEMNRLMLAYAEKVMTALKQEHLQLPSERRGASIKEEIARFAAEHNNDFIPIKDLKNTYQERQNLPSGKGIERPITYEGVNYEFVLNVPNIENADFTLNPVISPGLKARIDTDDSVFGWYLNNENLPEKILISEAEAMEMRNPLIVVSPHPVEGQPGYVLEYRDNEILDKVPSNLEKNGMPGRLVIDQYQVKNPNFYEGNGGLEYRVVLATSQTNSRAFGESYEAKYFGITRNDVSTSRNFTNDRDMGAYSDTQNFLAFRDYYLLNYEYDWARSKKTVPCSCTCYNDTFYSLVPRMRYSTDFWNRRCGKGDIAWPNVNSSLVDDNSRGSITIKRTM